MSNQDTFKKGSVELLVLALLQESNLYGYQISQLVKERSGNILTIPEGSMYPTLYRLEDKGYISGEKRKKTDDSLLNRPRWSVGFVSQRTRFRVVGRGNSESASVGFSSKRRTSSVL